MIYIAINEVLKQKKKTKYWFIKNMEKSYQSLSNLINNQSTGIQFANLDRICNLLNCEPGDIIKRKEGEKSE